MFTAVGTIVQLRRQWQACKQQLLQPRPGRQCDKNNLQRFEIGPGVVWAFAVRQRATMRHDSSLRSPSRARHNMACPVDFSWLQRGDHIY
jgi:hypothetical protein